MKIKEILSKNVMILKEAHIEFPTTGIVAITGANGHGKSAIIETIPAAIWNTTLRGTPWYTDDGAAFAGVSFSVDDTIWTVSRSRTAGGTFKFKFQNRTQEFDSPSKAKEKLESLAGTFDVWKRTHVFSSSDDAHFSRSTDGQKKAFIESLLAIDFKSALEACREDAKSNRDKLKDAEIESERISRALARETDRKAEAERGLENITPPSSAEGDTRDLESRITALRNDRKVMQDRLAQGRTAYDRREVLLEEKEKNRCLAEADQCDKCGQSIGAELKAGILEEISSFKEKAKNAKNAYLQLKTDLTAAIEEIDEDINALISKKSAIDQAKRIYASFETEQNRLKKIIKESSVEISRLSPLVENQNKELFELEKEAEILKSVDRVLGLKGVRANIAVDTLKGMEDIANHWLYHFTDGQISISIKPYRELKSKKGSVNEEWSMDVIGAGGGFGYDASSSGQRQRIDVALLFASAQIAQASSGIEDGTMFFDEVFDHLDKSGIQAVVEALHDLSKTRTVVVISHSAELVEALRPKMHLHVENGKVEEING